MERKKWSSLKGKKIVKVLWEDKEKERVFLVFKNGERIALNAQTKAFDKNGYGFENISTTELKYFYN